MVRKKPQGIEGDPAYDRVRLADMLAEAAELEHSLLCQYLFAAVTMKRHNGEGMTPAQTDMVRDWEKNVLRVARQEMEHLGFVCNILTAIGEAPHLYRPDFPLDPEYYECNVESKLETFGVSSLKRFVLFELPDNLTPKGLKRLRKVMPELDPDHYQTIGQLYESIEHLLEVCNAHGNLFIGPRSAQFKLGENNIMSIRDGSPEGMGVYNFKLSGVVDLQTAREAIHQIVEEGEGSPDHREDSHFEFFLEMLEGLIAEQEKYPDFRPGRDVVENPRTDVPGRGNEQRHGTTITNPLTNRVSQAYDQAYASLMLMLIRFFAWTDQSDSDAQAIEDAAFFPFMTMIMRPLGEVLTELPATPDPDGPKAGPAFRYDRRIALLPHRTSAFQVIYQNLMTLEGSLASVAKEDFGDSKINDRLDFMAQNVWRIAHNFAAATEIEVAR